MYNSMHNLLAHKNVYKNKTLDVFTKKGIELGNLKEVIEIYQNHVYMKYYPHYEVTDLLVSKVMERNQNEEMLLLTFILGSSPLVKLNEQTRTKVKLISEKLVCPPEKQKALGRALENVLEKWT